MTGCHDRVAAQPGRDNNKQIEVAATDKFFILFGYRMMIREAGGDIMGAVERYFA